MVASGDALPLKELSWESEDVESAVMVSDVDVDRLMEADPDSLDVKDTVCSLLMEVDWDRANDKLSVVCDAELLAEVVCTADWVSVTETSADIENVSELLTETSGEIDTVVVWDVEMLDENDMVAPFVKDEVDDRDVVALVDVVAKTVCIAELLRVDVVEAVREGDTDNETKPVRVAVSEGVVDSVTVSDPESEADLEKESSIVCEDVADTEPENVKD